MIKQVTYARLYALPGYENERFEVVAVVDNGDVDAAFDEARAQVEAQHLRAVTERQQPKPNAEADAIKRSFADLSPVPATEKQRNYIVRLQDDLMWTSEQLAVYAHEQGFDLIAMSTRQASDLINGMKRLNEELSSAKPQRQHDSMFRHLGPPMDDGDLPF